MSRSVRDRGFGDQVAAAVTGVAVGSRQGGGLAVEAQRAAAAGADGAGALGAATFAVSPVSKSGYVATYYPGTAAPGAQFGTLALVLPAPGLWLPQVDVAWTYPTGATDVTGTRLGVAVTGDAGEGGIDDPRPAVPFDPSGAPALEWTVTGAYLGGGTLTCSLFNAWNDPVADSAWWFATVTLRAFWQRPA